MNRRTLSHDVDPMVSWWRRLRSRLKCMRKGHRWTFLAYRRWPEVTVDICARCGLKEERWR